MNSQYPAGILRIWLAVGISFYLIRLRENTILIIGYMRTWGREAG